MQRAEDKRALTIDNQKRNEKILITFRTKMGKGTRRGREFK